MTFLLLVVALDRGLPFLLVLQMRILLGFFALFPVGKSVQLGPHSSPRVPASVSSSTLAAQPVPDSWWESLTPAQQAEMEEARAAMRREQGRKRKRKKRRKRRTRRFSLPPVVRPRCSASWPVWTRFTVMLRCLWFRLQKTVESPQLQSIMVVDISCRGADADSHGPFYHRDSPDAVH